MNAKLQPSIAELVDDVESSLLDTVKQAMKQVWEQVDAYPALESAELQSGVRELILTVFRIALKSIREQSPARRSDFEAIAIQASERAQLGITLADFLQGFRICQATLWDRLIEISKSRPTTESLVLDLAPRFMQAFELGSMVAAESYLAARQTLVVDEDRRHRDLFEALWSRRQPLSSRQQQLADTLGLYSTSSYVLLVANPADFTWAHPTTSHVLRRIRTFTGETNRNLAVFRDEEIVCVIPVSPHTIEPTLGKLQDLHTSLAEQDLTLRIGVSNTHRELFNISDAYSEASIAQRQLRTGHGVSKFADLSLVDFLLITADPRARAQIRTRLREFIRTDQKKESVLLDTFLSYVEHELNARAVAEQLHLHVNTVHYRLEKIAQATELNLRTQVDVIELYLAINLLSE